MAASGYLEFLCHIADISDMSALQQRLLALVIFIGLMSGLGYVLNKVVPALSDTGFVVVWVVMIGGLFIWWLATRRRG